MVTKVGMTMIDNIEAGSNGGTDWSFCNLFSHRSKALNYGIKLEWTYRVRVAICGNVKLHDARLVMQLVVRTVDESQMAAKVGWSRKILPAS